MYWSSDGCSSGLVPPSHSRTGGGGACRAGARRHFAERRLGLGSQIPAETQGGCKGGGGGCHGGRQPSRFGVNRRRTAPPVSSPSCRPIVRRPRSSPPGCISSSRLARFRSLTARPHSPTRSNIFPTAAALPDLRLGFQIALLPPPLPTRPPTL